ncbi:MAG TPA: hypothetical protein VIY08_15040 [Candidatus Nitrosocosmicus sp.]
MFYDIINDKLFSIFMLIGIVYPKTPLPPAREYVFVDGEYDTQNQLNPLPE